LVDDNPSLMINTDPSHDDDDELDSSKGTTAGQRGGRGLKKRREAIQGR
jgi:hypothetical protein